MKRTLAVAAAIALLSGGAPAQVLETPGIAAKIEAWGPTMTPQLIRGTLQAYGALHAAVRIEGVKIAADRRYGPHERHVLDVYAPVKANGTQPVLVFAHGGGFVRGDKRSAANIGRYMAGNGVVAITINYRLAPGNKWPSGGEDIAMALEWIRGNAGVHGGDPRKIVVSGHSAGAMHAADYTFHETLQAKDDGVVGAILISPPTVDLTVRPLDPRRDALYYGTEVDLGARSVVNALGGRRIPVMIAYAEHEPGFIHDQIRRLIDALARRDGRMPAVSSAPGHNHISIGAHIGTADRTLGPDLLEFIRLAAARAE